MKYPSDQPNRPTIKFAVIAAIMVFIGGHARATTPLLTPAPGSPFTVGLRPTGVATGDFNGDGKQDIAIANAGNNNVTVLLGNGTGGFTAAAGSPFQAGSNPI